jgi:hypothetical protein
MSTMRKLMNIVESVSGTVDDNWFKQGSFEAYRVGKESFEIADREQTIDTLEGPVLARPGDYIMTGVKGERWPISPENFHKLKTDNGDGTASPKKIVKTVKLADHDGQVILQYNGSKLNYRAGQDYIVKHGAGNYGVVRRDIFDKTYVRV